jgi:hypothetical protein
MIPAVLEFEWTRPMLGAQVIVSRGAARIAPKCGLMRGAAYRPLQEFSGLFMRFAETPQTAEGAAEFAGKFGMLLGRLHERTVSIDRRDTTRISNVRPGPIELAADWVSAIREMHAAVRIWRALEEDPSAILGSGLAHMLETAGARWRSIITTPVYQKLEAAITKWGAAHAHFRDEQLTFEPTTLLGALWFQFGNAIAQGKQFGECQLGDACSHVKWFEKGTGVIAGAKRDDSHFCSRACKQKHHRMRKAEARRRYEAGEHPFTIARRLETDRATVRGWLGLSREE